MRRPFEDILNLKRNTLQLSNRGKTKKFIGGFPNFETVRYRFRNITKVKVDEFIIFFEASAGLEITIVDACAVTWIGHILDDEIKFTNYAAGLADCNETGLMSSRLVYDFEFTFERVRQP